MKVGQFIGPFEVGAPLGEGGMAVVFHAWHQRDRTPVAIKVMKPDALPEVAMEAMFAHEVRAAARLNHPNVTAVFDHGLLDAGGAGANKALVGSPWLAMELVSGGNIRPLAGRTDWATVQRILLDVLHALAHAHAVGMIHRDIKPGNILIDPTTGRVKLTDFGLAQTLAAIQSLPARAEFMTGTPSYMAPEQIRGHRRAQGPWSDIYSVGALGWTLLTGRPPFSGSPEEVLQAHIDSSVKNFLPVVDCPPEVEAWLRRALDANPAHRFFSAADAAWALGQLPSKAAPSETLRPQDDGSIWAEDTVQLHAPGHTQPAGEWSDDSPTAPRLGAQPAAHIDRPPFPKNWRRDWIPRRHMHGAGLALFGLRTNALVGREAERDLLWQQLHQCIGSKSPRLLLVDGPQGVGKTTMMNWLSERAYELGQAQTLRFPSGSKGSDADRLGEVLSQHFRLEGLSRSEAVTTVHASLLQLGVNDEHAAMALVQLSRPNDVEPEGSDMRVHFGSMAERLTLLVWTLSKLAARRPLILLVENIQEDPVGLAAVSKIMERCRGAVFCLASVQTINSADGSAATALSTWRHHERSATLHLKPLKGPDRIALLRELLGLEPSLAARVESETGGNPQFAVQLVGHWVAGGLLVPGEHGFELRDGTHVRAPTTMVDMWTARLSALSSDADDTEIFALEIAATLGDIVSLRAWRRALKLARLDWPDDLLETMARLRLVVIDTDQQTMRFTHPMCRAAVVRQADHQKRSAEWAGLAADGLEGDKTAVRLRAHLLTKAGRLEEALAPLARAVQIEIDAGTRGGAQAINAIRDEIISQLNPGERSSDRFQSAILHWNLMATRADRMRHIESNFEHLYAWATELQDTDAQARLLRSYGYAHLDKGKMVEGGKLLSKALDIAAAHDTPTLTLALYAKAAFDARQGRYEKAEDVTKDMLRVAKGRGDTLRIGQAHYQLSSMAIQMGNFADAHLQLRHARDAYTQVGSRKGLAQVALSEGELARAQGRFDEAIRAYKEAKMRGENCENSVALDAQINLGLVCIQDGRIEEARRTLEQVLRSEDHELLAYTRTGIRMGLLNCQIAEGAWLEARRELIELDTVFLKTRMVDRDYGTMATLAAKRAAKAGQAELARRAWEIAEDQWSLLGHADNHAEAAAALKTYLSPQD